MTENPEKKDIRSSVTESLDGSDKALYPFFSYLLQDLWEIGSSPELIAGIIKKNNVHIHDKFRVLDLGCGKGAVSIHLAKEFEIAVHGIDAYPDFIGEAEKYAKKYSVGNLCTFEVGDIRNIPSYSSLYDLVILGSIGPVLGNYNKTLSKAKSLLKDNGYIILDDGFFPDDSENKCDGYSTHTEIRNQIRSCQLKVFDEYIIDKSLIRESNKHIYRKIKKRIKELINSYPEHKKLFKDYLVAQEIENEILENKIVCATWLLQI